MQKKQYVYLIGSRQKCAHNLSILYNLLWLTYLMAGANEQLDIGCHEWAGHRNIFPIRQYKLQRMVKT